MLEDSALFGLGLVPAPNSLAPARQTPNCKRQTSKNEALTRRAEAADESATATATFFSSKARHEQLHTGRNQDNCAPRVLQDKVESVMRHFVFALFIIMLFKRGLVSALNSGAAGVEKKIIVLLRHSTSEMNEILAQRPWGSKGFVDAQLHDTRLSKSGIELAMKTNERLLEKAAEHDSVLSNVELVVSSPLTRALHTTELVLKNTPLYSSAAATKKLLALPLAAERLYLSSDVGRPREHLQQDFPSWDFSLLPHENQTPWWYTHDATKMKDYVEWRPKGNYHGLKGEPEEDFIHRMQCLKAWLEARPEKRILLTAHWGVIRALTKLDTRNCEIRPVEFSSFLATPHVDP